jgi:metal-responsive CopG/Arc/MetJ family transcriptional regulator
MTHMPEELIDELEAVALAQGESRAMIIREACRRYVRNKVIPTMVREERAAYNTQPEPANV